MRTRDVSYLTGWFAISVDDRSSRALHEVGEIDAPSTDDPHELRAVLASWADEPDADGWPRLEAGPDSYAQFAGSVTATRHRLDLMRGDVTRAASRLRADHPSWRPGMTAAEHDGFEVLVLVLG